jgi:hypothetical protein
LRHPHACPVFIFRLILRPPSESCIWHLSLALYLFGGADPRDDILDRITISLVILPFVIGMVAYGYHKWTLPSDQHMHSEEDNTTMTTLLVDDNAYSANMTKNHYREFKSNHHLHDERKRT